MGPNGQAQYWAGDLAGACAILLELLRARLCRARRALPAARRPRTDPSDRDVGPSPHELPGTDLETVGEIFSEETNPGRKKPFDIRSVMRAVADADHEPLERWKGMRDAEVAVVVGRAPRRLAGGDARDRVAPGAAPRPGARRRPRPVDRRARCSRWPPRRSPARSTPRRAAGRWWCWPTSPASTARRSRCGACSSSTAPRSAGRSSTSTARSRSA